MKSLLAFSTVCLMAGALGCAPKAAPPNPTWVDDVLPILRGSCFHCHGASKHEPGAFRWDVYDPEPFAAVLGIPPTAVPSFSARARAKLIWDAVDPTSPDHIPTRPMPPAPAKMLSQYDLDVLFYWKDRPEFGTRVPNNPPTISIVKTRQDGESRTLTIVIRDPDGDQVMGTIKIGNLEVALTNSGLHTVVVTSDALIPAKITDGIDTVNNIMLNPAAPTPLD